MDFRQGNPLSPSLFTIVVDVLTRLMLREEKRTILEDFWIE